MPSPILCHAGGHMVDRTEIVDWTSGSEVCRDCIDVDELVKDRERLDWLIESDAEVYELVPGGWQVQGGSIIRETYWETAAYADWREAIDAAMKEQA